MLGEFFLHTFPTSMSPHCLPGLFLWAFFLQFVRGVSTVLGPCFLSVTCLRRSLSSLRPHEEQESGTSSLTCVYTPWFRSLLKQDGWTLYDESTAFNIIIKQCGQLQPMGEAVHLDIWTGVQFYFFLGLTARFGAPRDQNTSLLEMHCL